MSGLEPKLLIGVVDAAAGRAWDDDAAVAGRDWLEEEAVVAGRDAENEPVEVAGREEEAAAAVGAGRVWEEEAAEVLDEADEAGLGAELIFIGEGLFSSLGAPLV